MKPAWVSEVRSAADVLVAAGASPGDQRASADRLFQLFTERVGLDENAPAEAHVDEHVLPAGKAICALDAARCLRDFARSRKFMQATLSAIEQVRARVSGGSVRVLYAGCGPFAPLALPLAHRWSPEDVRFILLDYHNRSVEDAGQLARELQVLDRIEDIVRVDATEYRCPTNWRPDVVVCETMQSGLAKEPQVGITRNLGPQMADDGIWIPERVDLVLELTDPGREFEFNGSGVTRRRIHVGRALTLDSGGDRCFDITWPTTPQDGLVPMLFTRIQVFGDITLGDYESGLTHPVELPLGGRPRAGERLKVRYAREPQPGLHIELAGVDTDG